MNKFFVSPKGLLTAASLVAALAANLGVLPQVASAAPLAACPITDPHYPHCGKPHVIVTFLGFAPRNHFATALAACRAKFGLDANRGIWFGPKLAKCYDVEVVWF